MAKAKGFHLVTSMSHTIDLNHRSDPVSSTRFFLRFLKIFQSSLYFHFFSFFSLALLVVVSCILSHIDPKSLSHGIALASLVVMFFSYLTLKPLFETKQFHQILDLIDHPNLSLNEKIQFYRELKLTFQYQMQEKYFSHLSPGIFSKIKLGLIWKYYAFAVESIGKKILLSQLELIESTPLDLRVHSEYASTLMDQVGAYQIPLHLHPYFFPSKIKKTESGLNEKQVKQLYTIALEELKIVDSLSPKDPWTWAKLADCYKGLGQKDPELKAVEFLKLLRPQDKEILFKLSELYFENNRFSDGMKIYDQLRIQDSTLASKLLSQYRQSHESLLN